MSRTGGSAHLRGPSGWARQVARARVLDRDGHQCRGCGAPCPHPTHHQVDHVAGLAISHDDSESNKRTLCVTCHDKHTTEQARERAQRGRRTPERHPGLR